MTAFTNHHLTAEHVNNKSGPKAAKEIATLQRRMLVLRDRIDHLAEYLALHSDSQHADLSYEQTYATATADIADEFCAELNDPAPLSAPDAKLRQTDWGQHAPEKASPITNPRQMAIKA